MVKEDRIIIDVNAIYLIALALTGVVVGFASGMLGVGGGFIMVFVQFWVLTSMGLDTGTAILIAFGTNLAVILPMATSGALGHHRRHAVSWNAAVFMGVSGLFGGLLGGYIAVQVPGDLLRILFGLVVLLTSLHMLFVKRPEARDEPVESIWRFLALGFPIGIASGIIGIGGGVLLIPSMLYIIHYGIHRAVGTSTAVMIFTSLGGTLSYIINGWNVPGLPPFSLGYVNLLQFALLSGTSIPMAQAGVYAAHSLPEKELRYIFIALMIYVGLRMLGVFEWLGLPI